MVEKIITERLEKLEAIKKNMLHLIEKCISNKDFLFRRIKVKQEVEYSPMGARHIIVYSGVKCYQEDLSLTEPARHEDNYTWDAVHSKIKKHVLNLTFEDEPCITIRAVGTPRIEKNVRVIIDKTFLGYCYQKQCVIDIEHNDYHYEMTCGKHVFVLTDDVVNDIVFNYEINKNHFENIVFEEQLQKRIEKYS